jgi:hypothetical protein
MCRECIITQLNMGWCNQEKLINGSLYYKVCSGATRYAQIRVITHQAKIIILRFRGKRSMWWNWFVLMTQKMFLWPKLMCNVCNH